MIPDRETMRTRVDRITVSPDVSIEDALPVLDRGGMGILLLAGEDRLLRGVVTDGDIRRAMLRHHSFASPLDSIASHTPVVAGPTVTALEALELMNHARPFLLNHLSLVDSDARIEGLVLRSDLTDGHTVGIRAMVMAGGFGQRLRPMTADLPKPMIPIGDRPVMEHILTHLREAGIHRVNVTTHYRPEKITSYFGDGSALGLDIRYVEEKEPLGTAGALGLIDVPTEPMLVINGDILTRLDFGAMATFHREHRALLTVAVRRYDVDVPYGVVETEGIRVHALSEKPRLSFFVNAGIYLLQPEVYSYLPEGQRFDMTDLIQSLLDEGREVVSFPIREYWLDIGEHADYQRAQEDFRNGDAALAQSPVGNGREPA
jgi:dTDP-glucose pyrophosphorylase/CBS domain-containing protein